MAIFGVLGMTVSLTIAGYEQVLVERADLGGGWDAFFIAQELPWYVQAQAWRLVMGLVTFSGFVYLAWDLLTIGKVEVTEEATEGMAAQAA